MALVDDLEAIRDILQNPATRAPGDGPSALDVNGNQVRVNDPAAVRWNLFGAAVKVCQSDERRVAVFAALEAALGESLKSYDAGHSPAAVLGALNQAIIAAGGGGAAPAGKSERGN